MEYRRDTVFVTGASGLLGANLLLACREQDRPFFTFYGPGEEMTCPGESIDLAQPQAACDLIAEQKPAVVIHCAALTSVDHCENQPEEADLINAIASGRLAAAAHAAGSQFVYISTDAVFDGITGGYDESSETNPVNVYAQSKLQGEHQVIAAHDRALILRTNLYGWSARPSQTTLLEWILNTAEKGERIPGFVDAIFAPLPVQELARLILLAIDHQLQGLYHLASSDAVSKYEFARKTLSVFGYDPAQVFESRLADASFVAPRPANSFLIATRFEKALDVSMLSVEDGLRACKELRDNGYLAELRSLIGDPSHA